MKKLLSVFLVVLILSGTFCASAETVKYLPDVNKEMSSPDFWTDDTEVLMTYEEIVCLNEKTIAEKSSTMYDLKNQPEMVNQVALNKALLSSSQADAKYYLGWTYLGSNKLATQEDFDVLIKNTQKAKTSSKENVLYAIATERTELRTFPSDTPIWDDPKDLDFDYQYLVGIRVNEPLIITSMSKDGKYYLAKSICCSGWVEKDKVAICKDKDEWLSAWDIANDKSIVIYDDKIYTEKSVFAPETSEKMLSMGTVLEKAEYNDVNGLIDNRAIYHNYIVWMPVREEDGSYSKKLTLISENKKVSDGYLPLTKNNIAEVTFNTLGNNYGWGGNLNSDDCSGLMRNIYKCFGIELARNTTWQTAMPVEKVDVTNMCKEDKERVLDKAPFGSILYFKGHEMMYLGKIDGKYYVISTVSSIMNPYSPSLKQRVRSVVINTLDIKRANGNTWLDSLTTVLVPYCSEVNGMTDVLPKKTWYHDGVAYCTGKGIMKGDVDKYFNPQNNVTWAEFLQMLWNMEGNPGKTADAVYENWYTPAVEWAKGITIVPESKQEVNPEDTMLREEIAAVLHLYAQYKGYGVSVGEDTNILSYDDAFEISEYAIPAIQYAFGSSLMNGKSETTINPKDNVTRAEIAVIMQRFLN